MLISLAECMEILFEDRLFFVVFLLFIGVIFLNGWTDASISVATAVSTRAVGLDEAIYFSAIFNFLGVMVMAVVSNEIADTSFQIIAPILRDNHLMYMVMAAYITVILWSGFNLHFGMPVSETYSLFASLIGAAVAYSGDLSGIRLQESGLLLRGFFLSIFLGFFLSFFIYRGSKKMLRKENARFLRGKFKKGQRISVGIIAFSHGIQSGQKFMGVFMLILAVKSPYYHGDISSIPLWLVILCALVLAMGTLQRGTKIIHVVGTKLVKLDNHEAFFTDLGLMVGLLVSSILGYPVSSTFTKVSSIFGVGMSRNKKHMNWQVGRRILLSCFGTFPVCFLGGYFMTKIFEIL